MHQQHSSTMGLEMQDTLGDFDLSRVFDDEPLDLLWPEEPQSTAAVEYKMAHALQQETNCTATHVPQDTPSHTGTPPSGLVNLYMIVDPSTGHVSMCPKQLLALKNSNMPTTMTGPSLFHQNKLSNGFLLGAGSTKPLKSSQPSFMSLPVVQPIDHGTSLPLSSDLDFKLARPVAPTIINGPPVTGLTPVLSKSHTSKAKKAAGPPIDITKLPVLRALSAYNFFFQAERDKILNRNGTSGDMEDDWSNERKRQILQAHWGRDRTKKRRHRKSHGRISFIELSKEISSRWKKLSDEHKEFYRDVAAQDFARYQRETRDSSSKDCL